MATQAKEESAVKRVQQPSPEGLAGLTEEEPNLTAVKESDFPFAPPQQAHFEATVTLVDQVQDIIHKINARANETGWIFLIVQGGGADALTRGRAAGYTEVSRADVEKLGQWYGTEIPLASTDTLMRKPKAQADADRARTRQMYEDRKPKRKEDEDVGDGHAVTMEATSRVISLKPKDAD